MRCEEFESRLNEVLDERRPISSAVEIEAHILHCAGCREMARSYEAVFAGLRLTMPTLDHNGLTQRIVREARAPRVIRLPRARHAIFALAAAASLLMALGLSWRFAHSRNPHSGKPDAADDGGGLIAKGQPRQPISPPQESPRPERQRSTDVARANDSITRQTTAAAADPNRSTAGELMGSLPAAGSLPGAVWAQGVAEGLQPVTRPTVGAISGFLNLWGVGDEGHRS